VLAYLDKVDQGWFGQLRAAARAAGDDAREQLVGMFDALSSAARREGYHGCAFINTAAESDTDSDVHARTVEHKHVVRAWVTDLARRARAAAPDQWSIRRRPRRRRRHARRGQGCRPHPRRRGLPLPLTRGGASGHPPPARSPRPPQVGLPSRAGRPRPGTAEGSPN
jgi:hypothetical protein